MNPKLKKVNAELEKKETLLKETQEAIKNLKAEKKQLEDLEIVKAIRSMGSGDGNILELVAQLQKGQGRENDTPAFLVPETKVENKQEDLKNED